MKKWHWVIISVVVAMIVVIVIVFFMYGYFPRPFFAGGKYRAVNQYEVFRDLLIIILTLAGLSIAVLGASLYMALKGRVEVVAKKEAKKRTDEVQAEVTQRLVLQNVKTVLNLAYENWRTIKTRTTQKGQKVEREYLQDWSIDVLMNILTFAEETLPVAQNKDFWENVENKEHLMKLKNNLAFYMAYRQKDAHRKDARLYAKEIEEEARSQSVPDYEYLDTAAWVLRQFALNDKDRNKSEALVQELTNRADIPDEDKKRLLDKYQRKPKAF